MGGSPPPLGWYDAVGRVVAVLTVIAIAGSIAAHAAWGIVLSRSLWP